MTFALSIMLSVLFSGFASIYIRVETDAMSFICMSKALSFKSKAPSLFTSSTNDRCLLALCVIMTNLRYLVYREAQSIYLQLMFSWFIYTTAGGGIHFF